MWPKPQPPAPVDDGGYVPPPVFSVALDGTGRVIFGGSATGGIMVLGVNLTPDTNVPTELAFTRGGHEASTRLTITDIADRGIQALAGADMLVLSDGLFMRISQKLAADVSLKVTDYWQRLTNASVALSSLKTMEEATTGFVDASGVITTHGTIEAATHVLLTKKGTSGDAISVASNIGVGLSDITADAADLRAIEEATTGRVFALSLVALSGSTADVLHVLVTKRGETGDVIYVQPQFRAPVTLNDAGSAGQSSDVVIAATDAILAAALGTVTTKLIPGGTYAKFAPGDKIDTDLAFQNHTSQSTLSADGHLNWHWSSDGQQLTIETVDEGAEPGASYQTQTLELTGIMNVSETDGVFTLAGGL